MTSAEHTFLTRGQVASRYGWTERTAYRRMSAPGFPRSIGGRWRLDTLQSWEERELAGLHEVRQPSRQAAKPIKAGSGMAPMIPTRKRNSRKAAA